MVTYVAPSGARAASAGTYILYASHIAAMAPATNLGAATPVSIGGEPEPAPVPSPLPLEPPRAAAAQRQCAGCGPGGGGPGPETGEAPEGSDGSAMERKVVNDAVAYIRGLAELRGRNADWAEQAVRGAASLPASAALQQQVIDVIAPRSPDLLTQHRRPRGAHRRSHACSWTRATSRIVRDEAGLAHRSCSPSSPIPTVAYGLMLIGIWGLLLEGYNPGAVLPGVVGSICLLIALFAFQILSVNYAGPGAGGARRRA